ncbi:MAG TPA: D-2-hydroxyacid dehydrogenase, partial [Opitutales bacterium]|nr:D-2-hydroxyacid dehydrogenase [Opitutales bacterium]
MQQHYLMKTIVALDAHTLTDFIPNATAAENPTWDAVSRLGRLTTYPRSTPAEVIKRCKEAQIILTNKCPIDADMLKHLPQLEYIGVMATGYNIVDIPAAKAKGILVTNIPNYSTQSVAQHVFALLLELVAQTGRHAAAVRAGDWQRCADFSFSVAPFHELAGKTFGIIGFGSIGNTVAKIATALGMHVLVYSRSQKPTEVPVEWVTLECLLARSDVITLHCPLTEQTRHLINAERIKLLKASTYLINTARGGLIDEKALTQALNENRLAGFGADVLDNEPPTQGSPLIEARNAIITPHIAWGSIEARKRLMNLIAS